MPGPTPGPILGIRPRTPLAGGPGRYFVASQKSASAEIILSAGASTTTEWEVAASASIILSVTCDAGQPAGSPTSPLPITGTRRRKPFVGPSPYRRVFVVSQAQGSAEIILTPAASLNVEWVVDASAEIILTPTASLNVEWIVDASAEIILTPAASQTVEWIVSASAEIILTPEAAGHNPNHVLGSAEIILSAVASQVVTWNNFLLHTPLAEIFLFAAALETRERIEAAAAEIILSAHASETAIFDDELTNSPAAEIILSANGQTAGQAAAEIILSAVAAEPEIVFVNYASAEIILSAAASQVTSWNNFLLHTPLSVIILSAEAATTGQFPAEASATLILSARGHTTGGILTADREAGCLLILRCRADIPLLLPEQIADYLGRFQQGQEVPLQFQVFTIGQGGILPDLPPQVRMYRDGVLVDSVALAVMADTQVTGRFALDYQLGYQAAPGRYLAAYQAVSNGTVLSQSQIFEVVPGGDPGGPAMSSLVVSEPSHDQVLAHLNSGALVMGREPYIDEGV